jgi:hypothetical protein
MNFPKKSSIGSGLSSFPSKTHSFVDCGKDFASLTSDKKKGMSPRACLPSHKKTYILF